MTRYSVFGLAIFLLAGLLFIGTTYVIKEGDTEVGRWVEDDGSDRIEVIEEDVPEPAPEKLKMPQPKEGPGYQWEEPESPEGELAYWKISGQVIDVLRLKPIGPLSVFFASGSERVEIKTNWEGYFHGKLPQLENGTYTVSVKAPEGYQGTVWLATTSSLRDIPYRDRLKMRGAVPFNSGISGTTFEMQIGLYPKQLTKKEEQDYYTVMRQMSSS